MHIYDTTLHYYKYKKLINFCLFQFRVKLVVTSLQKIQPDQYELHYIIEIDEPSLYELNIWDLKLENYEYNSEDSKYVTTFPTNSYLNVLYIDIKMYEIR